MNQILLFFFTLLCQLSLTAHFHKDIHKTAVVSEPQVQAYEGKRFAKAINTAYTKVFSAVVRNSSLILPLYTVTEEQKNRHSIF